MGYEVEYRTDGDGNSRMIHFRTDVVDFDVGGTDTELTINGQTFDEIPAFQLAANEKAFIRANCHFTCNYTYVTTDMTGSGNQFATALFSKNAQEAQATPTTSIHDMASTYRILFEVKPRTDGFSLVAYENTNFLTAPDDHGKVEAEGWIQIQIYDPAGV